jgi:hypothetical protein
MKIYFEDGELVTTGYLAFEYDRKIDARKGVRSNLFDLDVALTYVPNATIYTNSIFAFSNEYAWNEELKVPEIYIRAGEHMVFTRIDKLTARELRRGHNLAHMYVAGEFDKGVEEFK